MTICFPIILILFLVSLQATIPYAAQPQDALLKLKQSLSNATLLSSWDPTISPCSESNPNWAGLICSRDGNIFGLRLENMGLSGKIDMDALSALPELRAISVMYNNLEGPMPNLKNLKGLKSIYLSNNSFEGAIDPQAFSGLDSLEKILLANNKFTGPIPISLTTLPELSELRLEGNRFQGTIPEFKLTYLFDFSMANNELEGPIPISLSLMSPHAFRGNKGLCGMPLERCGLGPSPAPSTPPPSPPSEPPSEQPSEPPSSPPRGNSAAILAISISIAIILLVILLVIAIMCRNRKPKIESRVLASQPIELQPMKMATTTTKDDKKSGVEGFVPRGANPKVPTDVGKLCFVKENGDKFDLPDLLKASAQILGGGCFGSSFKAILSNGSMMVVKRIKQMNTISREEFQEHMKTLGKLEHNNVVPLVAFYYRKDEKLMVSKFAKNGSLAAHLYGSHTKDQPSLDWPTRLNIIKGVARGLSYIYKELNGLLTVPHGHLKSSNVLLDESFNPQIHDYGLIHMINQESAQKLMVAYKAPEYVNERRINKKTDVWSLGILIIEVMTGQFPSDYLEQGNEVDLSSWVKEVVGDDKGSQVFDQTMGLTSHSQGEMQKMLSIGVTCCEEDVRKRWDINEACNRIEEVKERDNDDDFYSVSSYKSEGEKRSSRGMSDDFTTSFA